MGNTIFLFAGQGSQKPGMGQDLLQMVPTAERIFECGADILGFDIKKVITQGSEEELAQTEISQPGIFAASLVSLEAVKQHGIEAAAVAGHSLGEYAAMVAARIVSMEDGFRLIRSRAAAMKRCAQEQDGAMLAVMGLAPDDVEKVCRSVDGYVVPVNYNAPAQTVIAGERSAVDAAAQVFAGMKKKTRALAVTAAFHSAMMQPAADCFIKEIGTIDFKKPSCDFYSNVTGGILEDTAEMPEYLAKHLVSPVRFTDEMNAMKDAGLETFIELGPGKVLTGLVKKTLRPPAAFQVEDTGTLQKLLDYFAK